MKAKEMLGIDTLPQAPARGRKKKKKILSESWCKSVAAMPTLKLVRMREAMTTVIVNEYPLEGDKPEGKRDPEYVELATKLAYLSVAISCRMKHEEEPRSLRDVYEAPLGRVYEAFRAFDAEFSLGNVLCDHANALDKVRDLIATASMLAYKMGGE